MGLKKIKAVASQSERSFMTGVLVLSISTIVVKVIGLAYKIPMLSILGVQGMGYFNTAYEIYAILCVISTAGLPVAVSILISGARERGDIERMEKIARSSLGVLCTLGLVGSAALCAFAKPISSFIGNEGAYYSILAVSPTLLFSCITGAERGYFQGCRNMFPTALSQLIEALGKLFLGIAFALFAKQRGYDIRAVSAFAVLGLVIGSLVSMIYIVILKRLDRRKSLHSADIYSTLTEQRSVLSELVRIAFPITLGAALLGITRVIDMTLIMRRLQDLGIGADAANEIYGSYTTLAIPIFGLIPALVTPISESLVPRLSAALEGGAAFEQRATVEKSIRFTVLLGMPASMGIIIYSKQIISLLFANQDKAISIAAPLLSVLGMSVLFSCLITTTNAILQAYRKASLPIISMSVGAMVKAVLAYFLIGTASIGELGAPISTFACNVVIVGINLCFMKKSIPRETETSKLLIKPFFASAVAVAVSFAVYINIINVFSSENLAFLVTVLCTAAAYFAFAYLFGAVNAEDIASFPMAERLSGILKKSVRKKN